MGYYYKNEDKVFGPFSLEEFKSIGINKNTLVSSDGLENWQEASELEDFKVMFENGIPIESLHYRKYERYDEDFVPQTRPWIRYFARMLDTFIFGFILAAFLGGPSSERELIYGLFVVALWVVVEPIFLSIFGTTLGKWLFGIKLIKDNKSDISYFDALKRSFTIWWKGAVFGIPFLCIIGYALGRNSLINTGKTPWDSEGGFTIVHNKIHPIKMITIGVILIVYIYLLYFSHNYSLN